MRALGTRTREGGRKEATIRQDNSRGKIISPAVNIDRSHVMHQLGGGPRLHALTICTSLGCKPYMLATEVVDCLPLQ
eukprot:jgi/Botrbrau1/15496/Bobra.43_2s0113.1